MVAMGLYLLRALGFMAFALAVYAAFIGAWALVMPVPLRPNLIYLRGDYGYTWTRLHDLQGHGPVDVLVLGSSLAYRGFDPRVFETKGLSLYNLGSSSQTLLQTEVLVDRYLDQLDPALTLIEVAPGTFNEDGVESSLDLTSNDRVDLPLVRMAFRTGSIKAFNTLIYAAERKLTGIDHGYSEPLDKPGSMDAYITGGFVEHRQGRFEPMSLTRPTTGKPVPAQARAFERIMGHLARSNRTVVLIEAPVTAWMYASYRHHDLHAKRMASLAAYLNFNGMAGLVDTVDFFDELHLNQHGVEVFNQALLDSLKAHDLLPHPRVQP